MPCQFQPFLPVIKFIGEEVFFDKDAKMFSELSDLGFGFIEIGTLTPKPQDGNPKKRLFRLKEDSAIINRMGFNNQGAEVVAKRLEKLRKNAAGKLPIIGVNIGKSRVVAVEDAVADYRESARVLAPVADYLAVNVSSPNTPGLRGLQDEALLRPLLRAVLDEQRGDRIAAPAVWELNGVHACRLVHRKDSS